jgi:4-hydroxy-2-oxoglutarate aldolase
MEKKSDLNLSGIFPPIAIPFDERGEFAPEKMTFNITWLNEFGLSGYAVMGSNGEYVFLNEKEKIEVLQTARLAIPKDKLMIAGTGCESTRQTIELTLKAAEIGADAAIIVNSSYYKSEMTVPVLVNHYSKIADESPIPVIIYNFPAGTGIDLTADLVVQLSRHPNIIGLKDSGGIIPKMGDIMRQAAPGFQVLAGSASFLLPSLVIGAVGGVLALANIAPEQCLDIYRLFEAGDIPHARAMHMRMLPINQAITARFGVPGLKAAMEMLGYQGGLPRLPLLPLAQEKRQELQNILKTGGLL